MDSFEGYVGIRLWDDQVVNDVFFSLLFVLLISFALVFRANYRLFFKMVRDVFFVKERVSLFETVAGNEFVFSHFMTFQSLFLCAVFVFSFGRKYTDLDFPDIKTNLLLLLLIFVIILLFYIFKQLIYNLIGNIFAEPERYKFWKTNYTAITDFWGMMLYFPVLWILFVGKHLEIPVAIFIGLFIFYRFWLIYKTVRIFHIRSGGFLYIILYLCAQEILPLIFLYKGVIYLYNIIEKSALWH